MFDEITVRGIVLDTSLLKEYDKRLVILTQELGRITVFANGARRKNSKFTAVSQKFVMGSFILRPGRNSYTLVSSEINSTFPELSLDIEKMTYASYLCEVMESFTVEGVTAKDELNLLYVSFKALISGRQSMELIKAVFEIKLMDLEGFGLEMYKCIKTGEERNLNHLSLEDGGMICDGALSVSKNPIAVNKDVWYSLCYIFSRSIGEVYSFDVSLEVVGILSTIGDKYLSIHSDRHYKSLDILNSLIKLT